MVRGNSRERDRCRSDSGLRSVAVRHAPRVGELPLTVLGVECDRAEGRREGAPRRAADPRSCVRLEAPGNEPERGAAHPLVRSSPVPPMLVQPSPPHSRSFPRGAARACAAWCWFAGRNSSVDLGNGRPGVGPHSDRTGRTGGRGAVMSACASENSYALVSAQPGHDSGVMAAHGPETLLTVSHDCRADQGAWGLGGGNGFFRRSDGSGACHRPHLLKTPSRHGLPGRPWDATCRGRAHRR